jgi:hypothetical protein
VYGPVLEARIRPVPAPGGVSGVRRRCGGGAVACSVKFMQWRYGGDTAPYGAGPVIGASSPVQRRCRTGIARSVRWPPPPLVAS